MQMPSRGRRREGDGVDNPQGFRLRSGFSISIGNRICQRLKSTSTSADRYTLASLLLRTLPLTWYHSIVVKHVKAIANIWAAFNLSMQVDSVFFFARSLDLWIPFRGLLSTCTTRRGDCYRGRGDRQQQKDNAPISNNRQAAGDSSARPLHNLALFVRDK